MRTRIVRKMTAKLESGSWRPLVLSLLLLVVAGTHSLEETVLQIILQVRQL